MLKRPGQNSNETCLTITVSLNCCFLFFFFFFPSWPRALTKWICPVSCLHQNLLLLHRFWSQRPDRWRRRAQRQRQIWRLRPLKSGAKNVKRIYDLKKEIVTQIIIYNESKRRTEQNWDLVLVLAPGCVLCTSPS